ncbi:unnamed protein product [Musa hybrid cultivar]
MEAPAVNYSRHASPTSIHPSMHLLFCLPLPPTNTCYQIYKSLNFTLMQDEYLTSVSGYVKYDCSEFPCVSQLTFTTNLGKTYGPYGGGGGTFFEVNVEYDEIKGFFGQATTEYLTAFGVYLNRRLPGVFYYFIFIKELVRIILFYSFIMHLCLYPETSKQYDELNLPSQAFFSTAKGFVSSRIWHLLLEIQSIYNNDTLSYSVSVSSGANANACDFVSRFHAPTRLAIAWTFAEAPSSSLRRRLDHDKWSTPSTRVG